LHKNPVLTAPVLTGFNIEQLRSCNEQRYHYAELVNSALHPLWDGKNEYQLSTDVDSSTQQVAFSSWHIYKAIIN